MSSKFSSIRIGDIKFLNSRSCLYSIDYRATGEELDRDIQAMFKYENSTQLFDVGEKSQISRHIIVNENVDMSKHRNLKAHVAPRITEKAHISVYDRLDYKPEGVDSLWVGIPHPSADEYAKNNNVSINYTYASFLRKNDKILQKKLLGDLTPNWEQYDSHQKLVEAAQSKTSFYLKKRIGAGGFSVVKFDSFTPEKLRKVLHDTEPDEWYIEESAPGEPWSVQCVRDPDGIITVFGLTKQTIVEDTVYAGGKIFDISIASSEIRRKILLTIERMDSLLQDYVGFFGIDFMVHNDTITVLELNIRLTAASIPTLLRNTLGAKTIAVYTEDKEEAEVLTDDIVLLTDDIHKVSDTISFKRLPDVPVGYSNFIQLSKAHSLVPHLDSKAAKELCAIVESNVSSVISFTHHNFWPYGWTITMVLAESHCVISSWHGEKNILIDTFCCKKFDHDKFADNLSTYFEAVIVTNELSERHLS